MSDDTAPVRTLLIVGSDGVGLADDLAGRLPDAQIALDRAADWTDAERRIAGGSYDVVLVATGAESAELLGDIARISPQDAPGPKLIVISGGAPAEMSEAAADAGASDVLVGDDVTPKSVRRALRYAGEIRRMEARLADMTLFDRLTGLPSHVLYWQFLSHAVAHAKRHELRFAVMSVYVDGLSALNAEGGWAEGNRALSAIAVRLRDTLRASDTVARFSGPKFSLLVESVREDADAQLVAHRIVDVLSAPIDLDGRSIPFTATVGVALYPTSGDSAEALLQGAIAAMDRAKDDGSGSIRFA